MRVQLFDFDVEMKLNMVTYCFFLCACLTLTMVLTIALFPVRVQLFDFDVEVKPILEVIVGKTVEQSLLEVMEEEELANLRQQQREFEELRNAELVEQQRLEEQERRHREEKVRLHDLYCDLSCSVGRAHILKYCCLRGVLYDVHCNTLQPTPSLSC